MVDHVKAARSCLRAYSFDETTGTSLLGMIDTFYRSEPYAAAFITTSAKTSFADYLSQRKTAVNKKRIALTKENVFPSESFTFDRKRNAAFLLYGGLYQGIFQQYLYNHIFPTLFEGIRDPVWEIVMQVCFDNFIITPFLCLPTFYLFKGLMTKTFQDPCLAKGYKTRRKSVESQIQCSFEAYLKDVVHHDLLWKYWQLWIPAQTLTFGFIPDHYKVTFVAAVSFMWVYVFSSLTSTNVKKIT
jgi:Mpv17 / PMP22 family